MPSELFNKYDIDMARKGRTAEDSKQRFPPVS